MADVFVSYKKEERALAQKIVTALNADGFSTWWDDRLEPSDQWDDMIEREITTARAVVVLWTPASVKSQWVRSEAQFGKNANKLAPVTLASCTLPIAFMLVQSVDLTRWSGERDHANWRKLTAWLRDLIAGATHAQSSQADVAERAADWRVAFGAHTNGEPILDGKTITRSAPAGTVFKDNAAAPLMCVTPGGKLTMGSRPSDRDSQASEYPQRQVDVSGPFAISVYPVTVEQWAAAKAANPKLSAPKDERWGGGDLPVVNVSWTDARDYVRWLSDSTGERYRLPSEAEWEYACRSGADGAYAFGEALTPEMAIFGARAPAAVGSYPANAFGLCDLHGNVREWVEDLWHDSYADAPTDAIPWVSGHSAMRVTRGGSWMDSAKFLRSAARGRAGAQDRCNFIGFRVARDIS